MPSTAHHRILIVGGGTAGITTAARLRRKGQDDIAIVEPSDTHYYQPLWTLVGGGVEPVGKTARPMAKVMPKGVTWIKDAVATIDPEQNQVTLASGDGVEYDYLVVAPGLQLDWDKVAGLPDAVGRNGVSSNYRYDLAPKTWDFLKDLRGGRAIFTMPDGPIKCGGAPQKIMYLAADWWQDQGVLADIDVTFVLPGEGLFGVPKFAKVLDKVVDRYGIEVMFQHEMVAIDGAAKEVTVEDRSGAAPVRKTMGYDFLHAVPPQSAPDWLKDTKLSDGTPLGYVDVDPGTLQHTRYANVFALGDASNAPTAKTGAAVRKEAPVVIDNLLAAMEGRSGDKRYNGYSSCPITTARGKLLLAEFDYDNQPDPSMPFDTAKERYDMWLLKRYGLPFMYWNLMLKGLA